MLQLIELPLAEPRDMREELTIGVGKAIQRFPHTLDLRLYKGLERLTVNSPKDFVAERSFPICGRCC